MGITSASPALSIVPELPTSPQPKTEIEVFWERSKEFFQTEALELQSSISKNSCEFVMQKLKATQTSDGLQVAVLLLMYVLLIGVFKLLLWIVSLLGIVLFLVLKALKRYRYEKEPTEKEWIK
ncbi:MAG: hypothetical protein LBP53_00525 [Candidatus Peribacteria bacterium]|nr:hypothetical protein [Candidatus Peribacteria bacterium]